MSRMTPERWRQVEALFDEVVDLSGWEREAALDARCAGDPTLRREVEALLTSSEQARDMFEAPPVQVARAFISETTERDDVLPGQVIGAYRILRLLGRGGMGAVYLAERADGYFQKQVALKIVKRGMDTDEIVARFRRERQILARLQHPNIADLYDGGVTPNGLPYFVMELADGEPIDRFLDTRRCTIDARLDLFIRVCEAVQYAHRNLVVHRDLKPSNIMICVGEPKLLDFGIAKVLEEEGGPAETTQITRVFARRLTPAYAAPEQVSGGMTTTATDVYSLGVILYELLTGKLPMEALAGTQTDPERRTADPKPPSVLLGRLGGKTVPSEETERIADARNTTPRLLQERLSGDLDAIVLKALQEEPERRYETAAALADDLRRHLDGQPVAARPDTQLYRWSKFVRRNRKTVTLVGAAVVALMLGMTGTGWQAWEATRARNAQQQEYERAVAASDLLLSIFASLSPDERQGRDTFTRDEILTVGQSNLGRLDGKPLLQASVMNTLAQVMFSLGDIEAADSLYHGAYDLLVPLGEQLEMATSLIGMGEVMRLRYQFDDAEELFQRAVDIRTRQLGATHPQQARARLALAYLLYNQDTDSTLDRAQTLYEDALNYRGEDAAEIRATAHEGLGDVAMSRSRFANIAGNAAERARSLQAAQHNYREAIELYSEASGEGHSSVAVARLALAYALLESGSLEESEQLAQQALTSLQTTYSRPHHNVYYAHFILGLVQHAERRFSEASASFSLAAETAAVIYPAGNHDIGNAFHRVGLSRYASGDRSGAIEALRRAADEHDRAQRAGAGEGRPPSLDYELGRMLMENRAWRDALHYLRSADDVWRSGEDPPRPAVDTVGVWIARAYDQLGLPDSARYYRQRGRVPDASASELVSRPPGN